MIIYMCHSAKKVADLNCKCCARKQTLVVVKLCRMPSISCDLSGTAAAPSVLGPLEIVMVIPPSPVLGRSCGLTCPADADIQAPGSP
jgi:hypothetical protein